MLPQDKEILEKLSIADLERANAYNKDLLMGLKTIRSFPQGVTCFGSARLPQDHEYCKMAFDLGHRLAENGHPVSVVVLSVLILNLLMNNSQIHILPIVLLLNTSLLARCHLLCLPKYSSSSQVGTAPWMSFGKYSVSCKKKRCQKCQ